MIPALLSHTAEPGEYDQHCLCNRYRRAIAHELKLQGDDEAPESGEQKADVDTRNKNMIRKWTQ